MLDARIGNCIGLILPGLGILGLKVIVNYNWVGMKFWNVIFAHIKYVNAYEKWIQLGNSTKYYRWLIRC